MAEGVFRRALPASLLALALLAPRAPGVEVAFGDVAVEPEPEPKGTPTHGYTEYRVRVRNASAERGYKVTLSAPDGTYSARGLDQIRAVSRTVEVGPGQAVTASLLHPVRPGVVGGGLTVRLDGRLQERVVPLALYSAASGGWGRGGATFVPGSGHGIPGAAPVVLVSDRLRDAFRLPPPVGFPGGLAPWPAAPGGAGPGPEEGGAPAPAPPPPGARPLPAAPLGVPAVAPMRPAGRGVVGAQLVRAETPVTAWGTHWLGYSRYDGIAVARDDLEELRRAGSDVRAALWQYVEAGGVLLVLGPGGAALPKGWRLVDGEPLKGYQAGFGVCFVSGDPDTHQWRLEWDVLQRAWSETAQPWQATATLTEVNRALPVIDDVGVPVHGLFALMFLFSLAVGPVNLWLLTRRNRRVWLLATVPLISLVTCVAVFGYMFAAEGWRGRVRAEAFTVLDESTRRATTLGRVGYYSPLTPGDGLHFSPDTEVTALGLDARGVGGKSMTIDWTADQHLAQGWVSARVPAHFALRKAELRRERLKVDELPGGRRTVANHLGADVRRVLYADAKGRIYAAQDVPAGDEAELKPTGARLPAAPTRPRQRVYATLDWANAFNLASRNLAGLMAPRTYLAEVEGTPFLEEGLRGARPRDCRSFVLGVLPEGPDAR